MANTSPASCNGLASAQCAARAREAASERWWKWRACFVPAFRLALPSTGRKGRGALRKWAQSYLPKKAVNPSFHLMLRLLVAGLRRPGIACTCRGCSRERASILHRRFSCRPTRMKLCWKQSVKSCNAPWTRSASVVKSGELLFRSAPLASCSRIAQNSFKSQTSSFNFR